MKRHRMIDLGNGALVPSWVFTNNSIRNPEDLMIEENDVPPELRDYSLCRDGVRPADWPPCEKVRR